MRCLIFFLLFFASLQIIAQTVAETTDQGKVGHKILLDNGINSHCFTITYTPQGLFIGGRDDANTPINFLYTTDSVFQKVDLLTGYIVFDYSPVKKELLVAKYERGHSESMCREMHTYNLTSMKFLKQFNLGWIYDHPKYSISYDSIKVTIREKNPDGKGSHYADKSVKVK